MPPATSMAALAPAPLPTRHLLYLHGFRSSPQSTKARQVRAWLARHRSDVEWWCPQLPPSPAEAMALLWQRIKAWPAEHSAVIGSSLGGFYATAVAERTGRSGRTGRTGGSGWRAVLLNPAVSPARDLEKYIGEISAWHGPERFFFEPRFIDELRAITASRLTCPDRYFAIIAKGDEVLNWVEMSARYRGCAIRLLEGGDHSLSDFELHLPDVMGFRGLDSRTTSE